MLPENWFLKDGSLRDHGLDGEVEDLDIAKMFSCDTRSQKVERTNFRLTMPKTLFRKFPIIECISYPCFLCSRCMITGHAQKDSIFSFLGVTPVRTSSCQVCSAGVLRGEGVSTNIRLVVRVLLSPIFTGSEEMCLSLEHQNPSKTSEKMGYFDRVTVSLHIL